MILTEIYLVFGPMQIVLVLAVVLLLFGGRKIPELMRGLGSGIKQFKDASKDDQDDDLSTQIKDDNSKPLEDKK